MGFLWTVLLLSTFSAILGVTNASSFERDVVQKVKRGKRPRDTSQNLALEESLLSAAVPLDEYKAQLAKQGIELPERRLEDENDDQYGDDYYLDEDNMYSFSGYSLKYAYCQPIQRFSEEAIQNGEYSPMVTEDLVVLRLCPYRFCSSSRTYGCHYNFAEYVIGLSEYIQIMIRYKMDQNEQLCDWCKACYYNGRRLEEEGEQQEGQNNEDEGNQGNEDDGNPEGDDDYYAFDGDDYDDEQAAEDEDSGYKNYDEEDECAYFDTYCDDFSSVCQANDDDSYLSFDGYLDYLDCVQVADEDNYNYYVRPRCDGYKETIKLAVYHDPYCSQYAGNQVSLQNFDLGFRESMFEDFYTGSCLDCSESNFPPYFNANSNMCNRMHYGSAKCTSNLMYDLFDNANDDSTECSFIESIRFGTYDKSGELFVDGSLFGGESSHEVTTGQKWGIALCFLLCAALSIYACYLHHSITNLLIRSLSHTHLLPPSRHRNRSKNRVSSRSGGSRSGGSKAGSIRGRDRSERECDHENDHEQRSQVSRKPEEEAVDNDDWDPQVRIGTHA